MSVPERQFYEAIYVHPLRHAANRASLTHVNGAVIMTGVVVSLIKAYLVTLEYFLIATL